MTGQRGRSLIRRVRQRVGALVWRSEYRRLERLRDRGAGRRAFLVGSGPSLAAMDLSRLGGEFVCVVNMGVRAIGAALPHADMHVVTDSNRYRRFASEIEAIALSHPLPCRFYSRRVRRLWRRLPERAAEPVFLTPHVARLGEAADIPPLSEGIVRAPSVLLTGAVLLDFLGFSPIHVIGCDLDYEGEAKYFYDMGALDLAHERDAKVIGRRPNMSGVDGDFAILRDAFARNGREILNAGLGGNLTSLRRVDFAKLFKETR